MSPLSHDLETSLPADAGDGDDRLRVLCADDSWDIASMLSRLVRSQHDLEDIGVLNCADHLVVEAINRRAHVVVVDLTMPGISSLQAIRELAVKMPSCGIIAFTGRDDPDTREAVRLAGAHQFVSKTADPQHLLLAIRKAAILTSPPKRSSAQP